MTIANALQHREPAKRRVAFFMPETPPSSSTPPAVQRALTRIAHEIAERNDERGEVVMVGIQRGGAPSAQRLARPAAGIWSQPVPTGSLDVSMHRDDLDQRLRPTVHPTGDPVRCHRQNGRAGG